MSVVSEFKKVRIAHIEGILATTEPLIRYEASTPEYQAQAEVMTKLADFTERQRLRDELAKLRSEVGASTHPAS